jgi:hypothetical protein
VPLPDESLPLDPVPVPPGVGEEGGVGVPDDPDVPWPSRIRALQLAAAGVGHHRERSKDKYSDQSKGLNQVKRSAHSRA